MEDFVISLMQCLVFLMVFIGALCALEAVFAPRPRRPRDYRMPLDFKDHQRRLEENGRNVRMGARR